MAQLTCQNLSVGYENKIILKDINFSVSVGDYLCILGENGSGKSTLIRTILGLQNPIHGKVIKGDGLNANEMGYLPQQTIVQKDFPATVREIVLSGFQGRIGLRPFYSKKEKKLVDKAIEKMGIDSISKDCYRELSGGQQQRVLLARALCSTQKILILDEPVAGLDPDATKELYSLIDELNRHDRITIIMISHDTKAAIDYASHIMHIGKEIFFGTKEEYIKVKENKMLNNIEGDAEE